MNSTWLRNHTENIEKIQKKGYAAKKKAMVIVAIIFLLLIGVVFAVGEQNPNYDAKTSAIILIIPVAIIIPIVLLAGKKVSKSDITKPLHKNLESLLTTPELVAEFDHEMSCTPLCEFKNNPSNSKESVFFTEHYIGVSFLINNIPDFRFARYSDIKELKFSITRDETKVMGIGKCYFVDLLDSNGKKCLGLTIHGKENMNKFEEILERYCPGIKLQEHKLF